MAQNLKELVTPSYLQKGDTIAIMCMAGKTKLENILPAIKILNKAGFEVVIGKTVGAQHGIFGGDDELRQNELQQFLNDPSIKAIISARGGYGVTRFLDKIDFENFKKKPKWIVGFSDITALICHINNIGIEAIHGPMAKMFGYKESKKSVQFLIEILQGKNLKYQLKSQFNNHIDMNIEGELVGGNLCILAHTIGSKSEIDTKGKILFIEDVGEYYYNIDRMLVQLERANKLKNIKALLVGQFTDCKDSTNPFGMNEIAIISDRIKALKIPVFFGFEAGHELHNLPWISGRNTSIKVLNNEIFLKIESNKTLPIT